MWIEKPEHAKTLHQIAAAFLLERIVAFAREAGHEHVLVLVLLSEHDQVSNALRHRLAVNVSFLPELLHNFALRLQIASAAHGSVAFRRRERRSNRQSHWLAFIRRRLTNCVLFATANRVHSRRRAEVINELSAHFYTRTTQRILRYFCVLKIQLHAHFIFIISTIMIKCSNLNDIQNFWSG